MSDDEPKVQRYGRTWADVFASTSYIFAASIFLIITGFIIYFIFDRIPQWFLLSILGSFIFIPFLMDRAKEKADFVVILDKPMKMTEYRVGRKYNYSLIGNPVILSSNSGIKRTLLMDFDKNTNVARALPFAELTPLDQMRDMNTNLNLAKMFEENLRDQRISKQTVGIEVEKQSREIVDWALKVLYGSIIPTELEDIYDTKDYKDFIVDTEIDPFDETMNPPGDATE
jgi:hypothetical protein